MTGKCYYIQFITCFRRELLTGFVQHKFCLEEYLHADECAVSQHGRDKGEQRLLVAILGEVMFPDLLETLVLVQTKMSIIWCSET